MKTTEEKISVMINGRTREVAASMTLTMLLDNLDINPKGIAVELNREVVPKTLHPKTTLKKNDTIEIIRMTGGG